MKTIDLDSIEWHMDRYVAMEEFIREIANGEYGQNEQLVNDAYKLIKEFEVENEDK